MKLWFQHSNGSFTHVCDYDPVEQSPIALMGEYIKKKNAKFKVHYVRNWSKGDVTWYDVGSHTEFFATTPDGVNLQVERN